MLKRWQHTLAAVMQSRLARIVLGLWAVVAFWDTLGSQLMPPDVKEKWPTAFDGIAKTTGYFPFWVWILAGAGFLMAFVLEYAHRKQAAVGGNVFFSPT